MSANRTGCFSPSVSSRRIVARSESNVAGAVNARSYTPDPDAERHRRDGVVVAELRHRELGNERGAVEEHDEMERRRRARAADGTNTSTGFPKRSVERATNAGQVGRLDAQMRARVLDHRRRILRRRRRRTGTWPPIVRIVVSATSGTHVRRVVHSLPRSGISVSDDVSAGTDAPTAPVDRPSSARLRRESPRRTDEAAALPNSTQSRARRAAFR